MTTNDDDLSDDARPADPRTGAYRFGDLEREQTRGREKEDAARDALHRILDRAERRDGVPLAGGEQAMFAHDRPSTKDQYEDPKVEVRVFGLDFAEDAGRRFAESAARNYVAKRRSDFVRRCEGALMTLVGLVLVLVAWAFMAPRGTP